MKILAIDTSSPICSVAILENDNLVDEINLDDGRTHSENLMPLIDSVLKRNKLDIKDIEMISCSVGPGSFTGIRIGVSTIKPMAEILNIKIASVTSLEVLARNIENAETIVSLIDARNNQVYCGIFDQKYNKKEEYLADDISNVIEVLKKYENIVLTGSGTILHKELLIKSLISPKFCSENNQSAKNCGKIGYKKYVENNLCDSDTIIPIYLRKSQAERLKK
jgi:tRNA threonylcarbamoyladenosine biosynthesis protein TsaB